MVTIRNLESKDWSQFEILETDAFQSDVMDLSEFERHVQEDGFFGLFNDSNTLIGYLYCGLYGKYAHLHRIGILSSERGKKYGSILFEKAIKYFEEQNKPNFNLFVETHNTPAISLYKKYGLQIMFESWHFIIKKEIFDQTKGKVLYNTSIKDLTIDSLNLVEKNFPSANIDELKGLLDAIAKGSSNRFVAMFLETDLQAIARFNRKFSGCRPFFIKDLLIFDSFIEQLFALTLPEKDYVRITFDNNDELASLCKKRNFTVHHHLYKMTRRASV